ncbi:MAG: VWA-like domain-containing protein [Actinomycetota bacterium]|nr:VWA-like domain-containing protein [Actinomycetota bacterium]
MAKTDLFTRARANLVLSHCFFGALALRIKCIEDTTIDTACTDGGSIRYNPDFVNKLSLAKCTGLIAHEIMHPALLHHTRMGAREPKRWNMACDYAINPILISSGLDLPDGALVNNAWADKSAEEIYELLPPGCGDGMGDDPGNCGGVSRAQGSGGKAPSTSELAEQEAEWKIALAQAAHMAKQAGKLPAGLERLIDATLEPQIPWRSLLHQFFNDPKPADVTWRRPNRRFIGEGLYMPSRDVTNTGDVVVVIDTSGSISEKEINEFGSEIMGIHDQLKPNKLTVIYCDAAVNLVEEFGPYDDITFKCIGGGGTDFRPPFAHLAEEGVIPKALVYLTDGYGSFPEEDDVEYPVLWAINNRQVTPPFGQHLILDV